MSDKRKVIAVLSKAELLELGYGFDLPVVQRMSVDELRDVVAGSKKATLPRILPTFSREKLKDACNALGLAVSGSKADMIARIAPTDDGPAEPTTEPEGDLPRARAPVSPAAPAPPMPVAAHVTPSSAVTSVAPPLAARPPDVDETPALENIDNAAPLLTRSVPHRRPRLVWHGLDHREVTTAVPTQVVEIVRPSRFVARKGELAIDVSRASQSQPPAGSEAALPPNRLIWTNDNLVALQTLLDERDRETRGYRYRGKLDLVYIDPPFMVQSDFRAENAIDIDIDEDAGVQVKKEPSLVEILAYKDTWRQGLDSFLSMLRARLVLLKELLAPTGSIYVHLDWHAVHYVKVLMDEIFGYENHQHEIIWKRTSARSDAQGFNHIHDVIVAYGQSRTPYWSPVYTPLDVDYVRSKYGNIDEGTGKRYRLDNHPFQGVT